MGIGISDARDNFTIHLLFQKQGITILKNAKLFICKVTAILLMLAIVHLICLVYRTVSLFQFCFRGNKSFKPDDVKCFFKFILAIVREQLIVQKVYFCFDE